MFEKQLQKPLLRWLNPSRPSKDREVAIGAIAEIVGNLKLNIVWWKNILRKCYIVYITQTYIVWKILVFSRFLFLDKVLLSSQNKAWCLICFLKMHLSCFVAMHPSVLANS